MAKMQIILILLFQSAILSINFAATTSTENINNLLQHQLPCDPNTEICGCDRTYIFNEEKTECILNIAYLKELTASKNFVSSENDMLLQDELTTKIRESIDKVFQGIIASAIFFVVCCSVCVIAVLIFCCRIHYSDHKLKNEVDALAKKLKVDVSKKTATTTRNRPHDPVGESCNVIVQDANIMCV